MKTLCFALILSQTALEDAAPPPHIQDLLKKRVLYQMKQSTPDKEIYFDDSACSVIGLYEYNDDALRIFTSDKSIDLHLPYSDVISGKKLELSSIENSIETRGNILAAATSQHEPVTERAAYESEASGRRKWIPWVVAGAIGLTLGGYAIYNSMERKAGNQDQRPVRRQR